MALMPQISQWIMDGAGPTEIAAKLTEALGVPFTKSRTGKFLYKALPDKTLYSKFLENRDQEVDERKKMQLNQYVKDTTGRELSEMGAESKDFAEHYEVRNLDPEKRDIRLSPSETQKTLRPQAPVKTRHYRNWLDKHHPLYSPPQSSSPEEQKWVNRNVGESRSKRPQTP